MLDLKQMKIRVKTEEEYVTSYDGKHNNGSYKYEQCYAMSGITHVADICFKII